MRAEERHDSHCAINTWTPTRYIERMGLWEEEEEEESERKPRELEKYEDEL